MYVFLSLFTDNACVFFFILRTLASNKFISFSWNRSGYILSNFKLSWFSLPFLIINFFRKVKNNGDKATPNFRTFWTVYVSENIFKYVFHFEFHINKIYQPKKLYGCDKPEGDILQNIPRK